jgi:hypothetical protein
MMDNEKPILYLHVIFNIVWIAIWLVLFDHYGKTTLTYAKMNFHTLHPALYIAIESWCLFCLAAIMFLLFKLLVNIQKVVEGPKA